MTVSLKRTPAGVCSNCRRYCQGLHQVDSRCYHCGRGTFLHRSRWIFSECACAGADPFCQHCHGRGVVATGLKP